MSTREANYLEGRTDVTVAAVQDGLVAAAVLADDREGLDNPQAELLSLLRLVYSNVLDMSNATESAQEFTFDECCTDGHNAVCDLVHDDDRIVCAWCGTERVELCLPCSFSWVCNNRQD